MTLPEVVEGDDHVPLIEAWERFRQDRPILFRRIAGLPYSSEVDRLVASAFEAGFYAGKEPRP